MKLLVISCFALVCSCKSEPTATLDKTVRVIGTEEVVQSDTSQEIIDTPNRSVDSYIPDNWIVHTKVWGDLNKDGVKDVALILQNTDKANFILNKGFGSDTLDCNPRKLIVLFNEKGDFQKVAENNTFVPPTHDSISPCLADPLENLGLSIDNGKLNLNTYYWLSCGSYGVTSYDYMFRFQNNGFELIGLDVTSMSRLTLESETHSVNFMTKKMQIYKEQLSEDDPPFEEKWSKFKLSKRFKLEEMTRDTAYDFLVSINAL